MAVPTDATCDPIIDRLTFHCGACQPMAMLPNFEPADHTPQRLQAKQARPLTDCHCLQEWYYPRIDT